MIIISTATPHAALPFWATAAGERIPPGRRGGIPAGPTPGIPEGKSGGPLSASRVIKAYKSVGELLEVYISVGELLEVYKSV